MVTFVTETWHIFYLLNTQKRDANIHFYTQTAWNYRRHCDTFEFWQPLKEL